MPEMTIETKTVPIRNIQIGDNIRKEISKESIESLAETIKTEGLISPPEVRPAAKEGHYILDVGQRRLLAARHLGWTEITVQVAHPEEQDVAVRQAVENIQRAQLNFRDASRAIRQLSERKDRFPTQEKLASYLGRSQEWVSTLVMLDEKIQPEVWKCYLAMPEDNRLTLSKLREISRLSREEQLKFSEKYLGDMSPAATNSTGRKRGQRDAGAPLTGSQLSALYLQPPPGKPPLWIQGFRTALTYAIGPVKAKELEKKGLPSRGRKASDEPKAVKAKKEGARKGKNGAQAT